MRVNPGRCGLSSSTCRLEKSPWKPDVTRFESVPEFSHGVKSTLCEAAPPITLPVPLRCVGSVGPVASPHQLPLQSIVSCSATTASL